MHKLTGNPGLCSKCDNLVIALIEVVTVLLVGDNNIHLYSRVWQDNLILFDDSLQRCNWCHGGKCEN